MIQKQEFEVFVVWQCYILGNAIMDILNQIDDVTNSNTIFVLTEKGNTLNQMLIINPDGRADSWVPSSSDVFDEDWEIVE